MPQSTQLVGAIKDLIPKTTAAAAAAAATTKRVPTSALGKDAFMQLLVQQLKNQDPLKPMDNTQMISQMAQFSSLEQMQNLNKTMQQGQQFQELSQASALIGKHVLVIPPGEGQTPVTGVVGEVRQSGGNVNVVIDGHEYDAMNINQVSDKAIDPLALPAPKADPHAASATALSGALGKASKP